MPQSDNLQSTMPASYGPYAKPPISRLRRFGRLFASRPRLALIHLEQRLYGIMAHNGLVITRMALGIIFLWFGILKFLPQITPIDELAERTLTMITFHQVPPHLCLHILASWECIIGLGLLSGRFLRLTLALLFLQLPGTFLPLILLIHQTWIHFPYMPSFEGQYIVKNLVLISAGVIIGSTVRGGRIIANPVAALQATNLEIAAEERAARAKERQAMAGKASQGITRNIVNESGGELQKRDQVDLQETTPAKR